MKNSVFICVIQLYVDFVNLLCADVNPRAEILKYLGEQEGRLVSQQKQARMSALEATRTA